MPVFQELDQEEPTNVNVNNEKCSVLPAEEIAVVSDPEDTGSDEGSSSRQEEVSLQDEEVPSDHETEVTTSHESNKSSETGDDAQVGSPLAAVPTTQQLTLQGRKLQKVKKDNPSGKEQNRKASDRAVFVRGLPLDCSRELLQAEMERFGPMRSCVLVENKQTGKPKGTAFVEYISEGDALSAIQFGKHSRCRDISQTAQIPQSALPLILHVFRFICLLVVKEQGQICSFLELKYT